MLFRLFLCLLLSLWVRVLNAQANYLPNAHSHNDYLRKHPLKDALSHGFASVEADIFLIDGDLYVSHTYPLLNRQRLDSLYLEPLAKICREHNGRIYPDAPLILLIDIKSGAKAAYAVLEKKLKKYSSLLTRSENGNIIPGAITVIITGNKPYDQICSETVRCAFIDGSLLRTENDRLQNVFLMASTKYSNILHWKGKGEVDPTEKAKLIGLVENAHRHDKKVRLWASPENKIVWKFLLDCGVDLINTDQPQMLDEFLREK
ncbi:MAG: phosphatidylinositol-specific phospholipase C/glycerophosphodiester phosphodiesterase family protein [Bacteroidia bacterium]